MKLLTMLEELGENRKEIAALIAYSLKAKREFDPDKHPRDSRGRWSDGSSSVGMSYDKENQRWVDDKGKQVPKSVTDRLESLKIPKNFVGVKLNPDPEHRLQAVGFIFNKEKNTLSNKKYVYSDSHLVEAQANKFEALKTFDKIKRSLAEESYKKALAGDPAAAVAFMMDQTAIRVGSGRAGGRSDTGIGCCDLRAKHVTVDGNEVRLKFIGKSGVPYDQTHKSAKLATVVKKFMTDGGKPKDKEKLLFGTTDDTVRSYMRNTAGVDNSEELKPHQYRYWHGTRIATEVVKSMVKPDMKAADVKKIKEAACEAVKLFLNDKSAAVVFKHYIDPSVWQFIPEGINFKLPQHTKSATAFSSLSMEDLFDSTLYPDYKWGKAPKLSDLFSDIGDDEDYEEDEDMSKDYDMFLSDSEGFPEK